MVLNINSGSPFSSLKKISLNNLKDKKRFISLLELHTKLMGCAISNTVFTFLFLSSVSVLTQLSEYSDGSEGWLLFSVNTLYLLSYYLSIFISTGNP